MDTEGNYYLGRIFDPESGETTDRALLYDPEDLTTHAVVVGMTGSGKTGLCIDLLEEAALNGIPALMIDPKGDITNTLLHFPELAPNDFQPWVNPDQARRDGKTIDQAAQDTASLWRKGLSDWSIQPERIQALADAAHFIIYTPGSDSGVPVSILASLKAPAIPWEGNQEMAREKIASTVTAILSLVGLSNIDPVRSREHILLSNIFENAWSKGTDLDLGELILQTQSPPFEKLGVFDINVFYPEKERFELAMLLNNILAAPAFQTWIQGEPLDIAELLFDPDGRPRHGVFYLAHLSDPERMFFITLLYSAVESWMRAQSGTSSLRAIVYFDEIFGYLPPIGNPPSKEPMLRMLKQARAFGVSQVLVTQNPVDVDYKALSNAGTWMIGKLQTDQDKQRLLDGLEGATAGAMDRKHYDRLISRLGKRVFLMHNVHERQPLLFTTRWAMNYLAGPLTRTQIPAANQLALGHSGVTTDQLADHSSPRESQATTTSPTQVTLSPWSSTKPAAPGGLTEFFLPNNATLTEALNATGRQVSGEVQSLGLVYRPVLLAQAKIRFLDRKYGLDYELTRSVIVPDPDRHGRIHWGDYTSEAIESRDLDRSADPQARFAELSAPLSDAKLMRSIESDFMDWLYRDSQITVQANQELKIYAGPDVSQADFRTRCADAAREGRDIELRKASDTYDKKIDTIQQRIEREERELEQDKAEYDQRKWEELGTHAETVMSLFSKRRKRISSSLTKRRMTGKAKADVEESLDVIVEFKQQIAELESEKAETLEEINQRWGEIASQATEIAIKPYKKDIFLDFFGVAWFPYHLVQLDDQLTEYPGYINAAD